MVSSVGRERDIENSSLVKFKAALADGHVDLALQMYVAEVSKQNFQMTARMEEAISGAADAADETRRYTKQYAAAAQDLLCAQRDSDRRRSAALLWGMAQSGKLSISQMDTASDEARALHKLALSREKNGTLSQEEAELVESIKQLSIKADIDALVFHMSNEPGRKSLAQKRIEDAISVIMMFGDAAQRKVMRDMEDAFERDSDGGFIIIRGDGPESGSSDSKIEAFEVEERRIAEAIQKEIRLGIMNEAQDMKKYRRNHEDSGGAAETDKQDLGNGSPMAFQPHAFPPEPPELKGKPKEETGKNPDKDQSTLPGL
jgi:hypothetical protein